MPKLTVPRFDVAMADGAEFTVQALNPDLIRWDRTRSAKHWPKAEDANFLWMTFVAWAALKREGQISISYEDFENQCAAITPQDVVVDPTQKAREPDS